jgi:cytochrome c1
VKRPDPAATAARKRRREERRAQEPPRPEDVQRELRRAQNAAAKRKGPVERTNPPKRYGREGKIPGSRGWTQRVFTLYGRECLACPPEDRRPAVQGHHVVPLQRILKADHLTADEIDALAYDARNGMPVCFECHGDHESYARRISRDQLSPEHFEWADEHGFGLVVRDRRMYP